MCEYTEALWPSCHYRSSLIVFLLIISQPRQFSSHSMEVILIVIENMSNDLPPSIYQWATPGCFVNQGNLTGTPITFHFSENDIDNVNRNVIRQYLVNNLNLIKATKTLLVPQFWQSEKTTKNVVADKISREGQVINSKLEYFHFSFENNVENIDSDIKVVSLYTQKQFCKS